MSPEHGSATAKLTVLLCVLAVIGLLYLVREPLLRFAAHAWITEDELEKADAIVILSDDNFYADRATQAVALYRRNMAPIMVASGRQLRPYAGIAELMEHDLFERGVPKSAIIKVVHKAENTREEAEALAPVVTAHQWKRVIIVTSDVDARRARYIFRRIMPAKVDVRVAGARDSEFDADHWWETHGGAKRMFHEVVGMVVTMWELRTARPEGTAQNGEGQFGGQMATELVGLKPQAVV